VAHFNLALQEANWVQYNILTQNINYRFQPSQYVNKEDAQVNKIILYSANLSIPQTSPNIKPYMVLWWNKKVDQLRKEKQLAWKALNRNVTLEVIIDYRRRY